jgi:flagellar assembly protein FliH
MTSSHRATGTASVRHESRGGSAQPVNAWSLDELAEQAASADPIAPISIAPLSGVERAHLIDEGYARGLADGEKRAVAAGQARLNDALALLAKINAEMQETASLAPALLEENVAALAVIVARQIVAREVSLDRQLVSDLVRRALTEFPVDHSVRIRVNPIDLSLMTMGDSSQGIAPITSSRDVSWLADPRVGRGGCLVEGRDRIIDGRVDSALERAYHRMSNIDVS